MNPFHITLILATLLCGLVAGLVLTFAVVVMPGIGTMNDRQFIQAFQAIDRVIQNNHPVFIVVWVGSALTTIAAVLLGFGQLNGPERLLLVVAGIVYIAGVQVPTGTINVPLNNQLQTLDASTMDETALAEARQAFEPRWIRWNTIRTVLAILVTAAFLVLLLRL